VSLETFVRRPIGSATITRKQGFRGSRESCVVDALNITSTTDRLKRLVLNLTDANGDRIVVDVEFHDAPLRDGPGG
jgi:hypothetical protein